MASVVSRPLQKPNCCFVCETTTAERFFDSKRNFDPPGRSHLKGRRYICEICVDKAAKAFGFIPPKEAEALRHAVAVAEDRANEAEVRVAAFEDIGAALGVLKPKRASRKKADESAEASS